MTSRAYVIEPRDRRGLSRLEAAQYIGISEPTFDRLVQTGAMPKPKRIFARPVWDRWAIDDAFTHLDNDSAVEADNDPWAV